MTTAKKNILSRLRSVSVGNDVESPDITTLMSGRGRPSQGQRELVQKLQFELEKAHAEVFHTTSETVGGTLANLALAKGVRTLIVGRDAPSWLSKRLRDDTSVQIVVFDRPADLISEQLFNQIDAGLTMARGGIAETGSLIVWPTAGEPRSLSLIPHINFVVLQSDLIHDCLLSAMKADHWASGMPTNALLISGPSKTADIQQTLAYGAHGPRELVVLIVHSDDWDMGSTACMQR